jgi:hypothetical protein
LVTAVRSGASALNGINLEDADSSLSHVWLDVKWKQSSTGPYPLRFMKQVVAMMLATSPPSLGENHPELAEFVLDRHRIGLPETFAFYLSLYAGPQARMTGVAGRLQWDPPPTRMDTLVEVAWPPFAYAMTIDSEPLAVPSSDITAFTTVPYEARADIDLQLLVGFGHTLYPADYRTRAMIERDVRLNQARSRIVPE